ncbi:MAG TPA: IclR family transcriptional regulator [Solirubrobacteraceae bacterium]|nr:IclR family transcriptional regulator [Solirubrobacteraceae bacterium]
MEQEFQVSSDGPANASGTTAIDRGADLLVRVLESEEPMAVTELASAAGLPKSTASRLLSALERRGLVEQVGERGRLRPGPAILRLAERGMLERNVVEMARPALSALSERSGETINLAVPGAVGVEHLLQADSRHFLGAGQWVGRTVDYHCSANGKIFLAFGRALSPAGASALTAHAPGTITDPAVLRAELERVRIDGFAVAVDELETGLAAIAVPVRGASGEVVAALSVTGPTMRMGPARIRELCQTLVEESERLSARLGYIERIEGGAHAA